MVALNVVLMAAIVVLLAGGLAWAIVRDRRSKRASGGATHPSEAPLSDNLMMPHEVRHARRFGWRQTRRHGRAADAPVTRQP